MQSSQLVPRGMMRREQPTGAGQRRIDCSSDGAFCILVFKKHPKIWFEMDGSSRATSAKSKGFVKPSSAAFKNQGVVSSPSCRIALVFTAIGHCRENGHGRQKWTNHQ